MSIHQKMQSDYLWLRNAPVEQGLKVRNHGFFYLYDKAPNSVERLQMIYRSIGKQYDWEIEKFRLSRKGVDRGNKKRFWKNLVRLIKNPIGYIHWKTQKSDLMNIKWPIWIIGLSVILFFYTYKQYSSEIKRHDSIMLSLGKNVEGSPLRMKGLHNRKTARVPNQFLMMFRSPVSDDMITLNPTWRQNLRKELQLTNVHNVVF